MIREELDRILEHIAHQPVSEDEYIDLSEAARLTGFAETTIYGLTSKREIPHYKPGKKLRFKRSELIEWLESHRQMTREELISNYKQQK